MAITIKRTFILATLDELNTIPLKEGNWIALTDADGMFYDTGNPAGTGTNVVRREISGRTQFVEALPEVGDENNVYVLDTKSTLVGTDQPYYEVYCWENSAWQKIATNTQDINVNSIASNNTKAYVTGSSTSTSSTGTLIKREDVFISAAGVLNANGFTGGPADTAKEANHAVNADIAETAKNDMYSHDIGSYYRDVNVSGRDIVFTLGNGNTKSITTPFTEVVSVSSNGLAPQMPSDTSLNILSRDNNIAKWKALDVSNLPARSATYDGNGNEITATYVNGMTFNNTTRKLSYTKGNGAVGDVTIPDTSYTDYAGPGSGHGLVPASSSGDAQRYLRVDGSWQIIPVYTGASSSSAGTAGLVKAPLSADSDKFLKGDGSWGSPTNFSGSSAGLVPTSTSATQDKFLQGNGSWGSVPEYVGATAGSNGVAGLVNPAASADRDKFYRGDGQWSEYPTFNGTNAGIVPASDSSTQNMFLQGDGQWGTMPVFSINANGSVPGPSTVDSGLYLNASGAWSTPPKNTTGLPDLGSSDYTLTDTFIGDGTTVSYLLRYTPESGSTNVLIDGVTVPSSDYTLTDNEITFHTAPSQDSAIAVYYAVNAVNLKLLLTGGIEQREYGQTYTNTNAYILNGKLYSGSKEVATVDSIPTVPGVFNPTMNGLVPSPTSAQSYMYLAADGSWSSPLPTVVTDTSFTAIAGLDIVAKKYGNSYYITLDGTADISIVAGYDIASSATLSFNKVYAVGLVGSTPALFTLNGSSIICNTAISANDIIAVSFNALV